MGGRSSSSSSTLTSTTNLSSVKDQRAVADNGAVILQEGASGNTFNSTDFGAVSAGFATASRSLDSVDRALDLVTARGELDKAVVLGATSLATKANEQAGTSATAALSAVGAAYKDAQEQAQGNRTLAYVGLTVAGVLALGLLQNRRKA
jgi:hypothetical protein